MSPLEPATVAAAALPKPPTGSLHPIGGVYMKQEGRPNEMDNVNRIMLRVNWTSTSDSMESSWYDLAWLLQCRYDEVTLTKLCLETAVTKANALCAGETLESVPFHDLVVGKAKDDASDGHQRHARFDILDAVVQRGAAIVSHAPYEQGQGDVDHSNDTDTAAVALVGKALSGGRLSHGHLYGDVFYVQSIPNAHNIAYTSVALCPHQDFPYFSSPPGWQLLHCVENGPSVVGGESTLIDAVAAAEEFRTLAPGLFDILVQCDATFVKQREGADLVYRRPHIELDATKSRVVSVRWAPPFEGPLAVAPHLVYDYYVAYTAFERMVDNALPRLSTTTSGDSTSVPNRLLSKLSPSLEVALCDYAHTYTWEQRLVPGEILVFNNQRILHGRRAFSFQDTNGHNGERGQRRLLMGCYLNIDDTMSEYRLLRRERYQEHGALPNIPLVGNGNSFVL